MPAAASALLIMFKPQFAIEGTMARMMAGAWRLGVSWNACEPINIPM